MWTLSQQKEKPQLQWAVLSLVSPLMAGLSVSKHPRLCRQGDSSGFWARVQGLLQENETKAVRDRREKLQAYYTKVD